MSLSITEVEYIVTSVACAQILCMKQTLIDYGITSITSPIMCDETSAINLSKNLIRHSCAKYIGIQHHFLHDHTIKGVISLNFIYTGRQIADIFTKPLKENEFMKFKRDD